MQIKLLLLLFVASVAVIVISWVFWGETKTPLLPKSESPLPWGVVGFDDSGWQGASEHKVLAAENAIEYNYALRPGAESPSAGVTIEFRPEPDSTTNTLVDLSSYDSISFVASCTPGTSFIFIFETFDDKVSKPGTPLSYRKASRYFDCSEAPQVITLDLNDLTVPEWWLDLYGFEYSQNGYDLNKVRSLSIINSEQSPYNVKTRVTIENILFRNNSDIYWFYALLVMIPLWAFSGIKIARIKKSAKENAGNTNLLKNKLEGELNNEGWRFKKKSVVLKSQTAKETHAAIKFLNNEYTNPSLSMEYTVTKTGLNKNKINSALKQYTGLTYSAYVRKLRIDHACELLLSQNEESISKISSEVGYKNINTFNSAFKAQLKLSPKEYRDRETNKIV